MRLLKKHFLMLLLFIAPLAAMAQLSVSGTVTDASNNPLSGVSVKIRNSNAGTSTDAEGKFSINIPGNRAVLEFSYVGFTTQSVTIANSTSSLAIKLVAVNSNLDEIIVTGSRALPRSSATTPLPVDNLDVSVLKTTGQTTFDKALQYRVPSFNTVNTPVNDATTLLDPYEIRNLGPSRTLILINGKRKNLSSLLYVQFSPGRGETGADLSAIPTDAIKRVEILRDGASAQYGSDAIAGVMNVILKDRFQYGSLTLKGGVTGKGDGGTYGIAYNGGANISSRGFINYTVDFSQQNNAVRSGIIHRPTEKYIFGGDPSTDAAIDAYLTKYPNANNTNGTGEITAAKFNYNLGIPIGENGMFYSNAGLVAKKAISNANFRTPYWRTDAGLLHNRIPGAPNYTGGNDPLYEGYIGYRPSFEGDLLDYNATFGVKSEKNGWKHDVSFTMGGNQQLYTVENTVNRSLGTASPTAFKPGGFRFTNLIGNYDVSKSLTDNFSLAFGTEIRNETYKIISGDTASYSKEGANSFPGIRAENASTNSRFNFGAYVDASWDITKDFLLNGAFRTEKYSDFGNASVWKVSTRYKTPDNKFVIRGSASTGFRAPTLHQIYAQSTQASFVQGTIQLSGLFNNRSKQAFLLGVPRLKPEKSDNYTVGIGFNPNKNISLTVDYYNITIKDRIVYSSSISTDDPSTQLYQILQAAGVVQANFFINGIKTRTSGIDYVASYRNIPLGKAKLGINVAGNVTISNEILGSPNNPKAISDAGGDILSAQIRSLLTESRPKYKTVLGLDLNVEKWSFNITNTLFGTTKFQDLDNGDKYRNLSSLANDASLLLNPDPGNSANSRNVMNDIRQKFKTAVVTDLNIGYDITSKVSASVTINNIFNVLPKWNLESLNSNGQKILGNATAKDYLEGLLSFSGRYRILGYNGSQFSQLGTIFNASVTFKF
ncbi:MAG: TonB-dependent receptor [Sphingobacteriales bacterium]|nr:TonB-dependent receptor [Sphingobacteriales bacterium]MBI3718343.1 TonB-dependent receptor [Sphingobacteriales bacterium]